MHGTGAVRIGKDAVYAYFTTTDDILRVRVSADDSDRLDLFPGKQVRIGFQNREPAGALVTAIEAAPPFVWVELEWTMRATRGEHRAVG